MVLSWWRGEPSLSWFWVMGDGCSGVLHCLLHWGGVNRTLRIHYLFFIYYYLLFISPGLLASAALALQGGLSVTPRSKSANFFLSARKFGSKG